VLEDIGHNLKSWKEKVLKEKSIYHTMNMFNYDIGRKCLIAEGWCPRTATEKIVNAMRQATESSGALVPSILSVIQANEEPPTYFKTNKFTSAFQNIVEAYGIAHYREVNPGIS
jgi:V-type H+-transporting ATPase subunit a